MPLFCHFKEENEEKESRLRDRVALAERALEQAIGSTATRSHQQQNPPPISRRTRSQQITCCDYGPDRREAYDNAFFFCSPCDHWDSLTPDLKKRAIRNTCRNRCEANHRNPSMPTHRVSVTHEYCGVKVSPEVAEAREQEKLQRYNEALLLEEKRKRAEAAQLSSYLELDTSDDSSIHDSVSSEKSEATSTNEHEQPQCTPGVQPDLSSHPSHEKDDSLDTRIVHDLPETTHTLTDSFQSPTQILPRICTHTQHAAATPANQPPAMENPASVITPEVIRDSVVYTNLKRKYDTLQEKCRRMKQTIDDPSKLSAPKILSHLANKVEGQPQHSRVVTTVSKALINKDGPLSTVAMAIHEKVIQEFRNRVRDDVYSPDRILKAMDLSGGGLCMTGVGIMREIETQGEPYKRGLLPSPSALARAAEIVKLFAEDHLPFKSFNLPPEHGGGEGIWFDPKIYIPEALKAFKLLDHTKERPVSVAQSIDGAQLTFHQGHVTYGFKINDKGAVCPITGRGTIDAQGRVQQSSCFKAGTHAFLCE